MRGEEAEEAERGEEVRGDEEGKCKEERRTLKPLGNDVSQLNGTSRRETIIAVVAISKRFSMQPLNIEINKILRDNEREEMRVIRNQGERRERREGR